MKMKNEWAKQGMNELYWDNPVAAINSPINQHINQILQQNVRAHQARKITEFCETLDQIRDCEKSGDIAGLAAAYLAKVELD